jgi:hypothetical protein
MKRWMQIHILMALFNDQADVDECNKIRQMNEITEIGWIFYIFKIVQILGFRCNPVKLGTCGGL